MSLIQCCFVENSGGGAGWWNPAIWGLGLLDSKESTCRCLMGEVMAGAAVQIAGMWVGHSLSLLKFSWAWPILLSILIKPSLWFFWLTRLDLTLWKKKQKNWNPVCSVWKHVQLIIPAKWILAAGPAVSTELPYRGEKWRFQDKRNHLCQVKTSQTTAKGHSDEDTLGLMRYQHHLQSEKLSTEQNM